jgi:hypothetical protein
VQRGAVHLGDRRRGKRNRIDRADGFFQRSAEALLEDRPEGFEGHAGRVVLQALELRDPVGAEQVRAGGQHLAELHERRPERFHGLAQPDRRRRGRARLPSRRVQQVAGAFQRTGQADARDRVGEPEPHQDGSDFVQAPDVARGGEGVPGHVRFLAGAVSVHSPNG